MPDSRVEDLPRASSKQGMKHKNSAESCTICHFPVRLFSHAIRLVGEDGVKVWVCEDCWVAPVERVLSTGM